MHAIILAGGFGKRLQSILPHVPKPMAPIHGKPFLTYLLKYLAKKGFRSVILSLHHHAEMIQGYFGTHYAGIHISYTIEPDALGTGGAIVNALKENRIDTALFVINGDTFVTIDYCAMFSEHARSTSRLTIALSEVADCSRYGKATVCEDKVVTFSEKQTAGSGLINTGIYVIHPDLFKTFVLPQRFSFEDFIFTNLNILKPSAYIGGEYFIDIGIADDYFRAQREIPTLEVF